MNYRTVLLTLIALSVAGCVSTAEHQLLGNELKPAAVDTLDLKRKSANSLDDYILEALTHSAELKSAFSRYQAKLEKNAQVTALPDPRVSYGYFINEIETRVGPQEHKLGLSQAFPWFGTLELKGEIADAEARAEFYRFLTLKNKLVHDLKRVYFEITYLHKAQRVTKDTLDLVKQWEQVLLQRFRTGNGSHADLIKVQLELGKLEDRLAELTDLEVPLIAEFNALLNRAPEEKIKKKTVEKINGSASNSVMSLALADEELDRILREHNPELLMLDAFRRANEDGIKLAKKDFFPNLTLGVDYTFIGDRDEAGTDGGDDALMTMLSLNIPLYREKYHAKLRESKKLEQSTSSALEARLFSLKAAAASARYKLRDSSRRIKLYEQTLIPKARETIEATFTAFEGGEAPFLDVLDAERLLLDFELLLSRAHADLYIASSELQRLSGGYSESAEKTTN